MDEVRKPEMLGPDYSRTKRRGLTFILVGSKLLIILIWMPRLLVSLCNRGRGLYLQHLRGFFLTTFFRPLSGVTITR